MTARDSVLSAVQLLASASEQRGYEQDVPLAAVPSELAEAAHDLFQPKSAAYLDSFSDDELRDLAHLFGLVREAAPSESVSVTELHKRPEWRRVIAVAKEVAARLGAR